MAKAKSPGADKFHVGQTCILVLADDPRWQKYSGTHCVVIAPKRYGEFECRHPSDGLPVVQKQWRYRVRYTGGATNVTEDMLRPIYDGEKLSTWEKFAKKTGIDIKAPVRVRAKREKSNG